jgi:hypothetical protein
MLSLSRLYLFPTQFLEVDRPLRKFVMSKLSWTISGRLIRIEQAKLRASRVASASATGAEFSPSLGRKRPPMYVRLDAKTWIANATPACR